MTQTLLKPGVVDAICLIFFFSCANFACTHKQRYRWGPYAGNTLVLRWAEMQSKCKNHCYKMERMPRAVTTVARQMHVHRLERATQTRKEFEATRLTNSYAEPTWNRWNPDKVAPTLLANSRTVGALPETSSVITKNLWFAKQFSS